MCILTQRTARQRIRERRASMMSRKIKCQHPAQHGGTHLSSQLLGRLTQEDRKFQASLSNFARPCLKIQRAGVEFQTTPHRAVPDRQVLTWYHTCSPGISTTAVIVICGTHSLSLSTDPVWACSVLCPHRLMASSGCLTQASPQTPSQASAP